MLGLIIVATVALLFLMTHPQYLTHAFEFRGAAHYPAGGGSRWSRRNGRRARKRTTAQQFKLPLMTAAADLTTNTWNRFRPTRLEVSMPTDKGSVAKRPMKPAVQQKMSSSAAAHPV